jgi:4-amino-4-deoxy-L-arabinose transferase-like glycosyltransferase
MSVIKATSGSPARIDRAVGVSELALPAVLYAVALTARVMALLAVRFPLSEGSAYYVAVARNIASGRGPVIDAFWSYSTPPLVLPRPAFELWQPLASFLAAAPMRLLGPSFSSAQLGFALFGALLAPLTWWIARDAALRLDLPRNRASAVAGGAGLLVAIGGPFLLDVAVPDSTLPFTVLAVAACAVLPSAARGRVRALVGLGVLLGLAYLTRMEAAYIGLVFVAIAWACRPDAGGAFRATVVRSAVVAGIAALVALPWWVRNIAVFGSPMPGQLADNVFLTRNDQIFAYRDPPSLAGFLAQGPIGIATNIAVALWHDAIDVLIVPGNVIAVAALLTIIFGWRRRSAFRGSALVALIGYGAVAFLVTSFVFPVATLWGTFEHAAGPVLIALTIIALLGADAFVARVRTWRSWPRPNAGMAPAALGALVLTLSVLQITIAGAQAASTQFQIASVADTVRGTLAPTVDVPILSDRPIWMSDALVAPVLVLPNESAASVLALARAFSATSIVLVDGRGNYPSAFEGPASQCFVSVPAATRDAPAMAIYSINEACK